MKKSKQLIIDMLLAPAVSISFGTLYHEADAQEVISVSSGISKMISWSRQ